MGLEATEIGIQIFFYYVLPGFMFFISFRWTAGFKEKVGELGSLCAAVFFGILLFLLVKEVRGDNIEKFTQFLMNPFVAGMSLSLVGLVVGTVLGLPVGWARSKLRY